MNTPRPDLRTIDPEALGHERNQPLIQELLCMMRCERIRQPRRMILKELFRLRADMTDQQFAEYEMYNGFFLNSLSQQSLTEEAPAESDSSDGGKEALEVAKKLKKKSSTPPSIHSSGESVQLLNS